LPPDGVLPPVLDRFEGQLAVAMRAAESSAGAQRRPRTLLAAVLTTSAAAAAVLAFFLAAATAGTVFIISYGYSRIIEQFPSGRSRAQEPPGSFSTFWIAQCCSGSQ